MIQRQFVSLHSRRIQQIQWVRRSFSSFGNNNNNDNSADKRSTSNPDWRRQQLNKLEQKFAGKKVMDPSNVIVSDEDLQPYWSNMESRLKNRRSRTEGRTGRANVRKTDEEIWLQEGLYDSEDEDGGDNKK